MTFAIRQRTGWGRACAAWTMLALLLAPLVVAWIPQVSDLPTNGGFSFAALLRSCFLAAIASLLSVGLGWSLAAGLLSSRLPARGLWITVLLAPFAAPATVWTLAQVACFGRGGLLEQWLGDSLRPWLTSFDSQQYIATTLVLAQVHAPVAMLILLRGISRLHFAGAEAAELFLARSHRWRWRLRALRKEITAALLITLAMSLANFSVPHVMQCRLYIVDVYMRSANYLDQPGALRTALPLMAVALAAAVGFSVLDRGIPLAAGVNSPERVGSRGKLVMLGISSYIVMTILLPIVALAHDCRSLVNFVANVRDATPETVNTLFVGGGAAIIGSLVAGIVAPWSVRRGLPLAEVLTMLPLGLPPLVIGLAYARTFHQSWLTGLAFVAESSLLAMLGLACRGLPFAARMMAETARRHPVEWDEAAGLAHLSVWRRWRWVTAPLWMQSIFTAAIVVFVISAGDVEISHLLTAPGSGTLAMRLFTFLHFGPAHVTASLALWQLIVALTPVGIYFLLTDRWLRIV